MIEVLRLGHRISRDKRIGTHVALVARAFGAKKLYYTGQKDSDMEDSIEEIVKGFGGDFDIEYVKTYKKLFKNKIVVHLTVYGLDFREKIEELKGKDILVVVGGEKVPIEIYKEAYYNLSVTNQPHSEVGALAVFLDHFVGSYPIFKGKMNIKPSARGKVVLKRKL